MLRNRRNSSTAGVCACRNRPLSNISVIGRGWPWSVQLAISTVPSPLPFRGYINLGSQLACIILDMYKNYLVTFVGGSCVIPRPEARLFGWTSFYHLNALDTHIRAPFIFVSKKRFEGIPGLIIKLEA